MTTIKLFCSQRICWIFSVFFFFFSFSVSLLLLGFFGVFFQSQFIFTSCWSKWRYCWPTLCLSVCQLSGVFPMNKVSETKEDTCHCCFSLSLFLILHRSRRLLLNSASCFFPSGTSVWTRAPESWPPDRTSPRAATGWGSGCLMGSGPTWSRGSEFTSGTWWKRPSCRPPRCVWPVRSAETPTHLLA